MPTHADVDCRQLLTDGVTIFILLPSLLAAIHFLVPIPIQTQLALDYANPNPLTPWTSAFIHNSDAHLYGNLMGGFGGALVAYILCLDVGKREWFRRTVVAFLVVLPVAVNLASLALFWYLGVTGVTGRGFSGVAAGFAGFTITALVVWVREHYSGVEGYVLMLVVALLGVEIFLIYGAVPSIPGLLLFGVAVILGVSGIGYQVCSGGDWETDGVGQHAARIMFAGLVVVFIGVFVLVLFPMNLVEKGSSTNIFAHLAGVIFGGLLSYSQKS